MGSRQIAWHAACQGALAGAPRLCPVESAWARGSGIDEIDCEARTSTTEYRALTVSAQRPSLNWRAPGRANLGS
jgi:hypothetical protein